MQWEIKPFIGLGPLSFGMSSGEIASLNGVIGQVTATHPAFNGSVNEYRGLSSPVCNYMDGKLVGIDTDRNCNDILFNGINLYKSNPEDVLKMLYQENGGAKISFRSILFNNLGINTSSFFIYDKDGEGYIYNFNNYDKDERCLTLFVRGAFDEIINQFQPIEF